MIPMDSVDVLVNNQAYRDGVRDHLRIGRVTLTSGKWADFPRTQDPLGSSALWKAEVRTAGAGPVAFVASGTEGSVELIGPNGVAGTFAWNFPLVGSNWCAFTVDPQYVVTQTLTRSVPLALAANRITLGYTLRRRDETTPPTAIPSGGRGVVRGTVRWSSARLRLLGDIAQALDIGIAAPAVFKKWGPGTARYGGVAGTFEGRQRVGRAFYAPVRRVGMACQRPGVGRLDKLGTSARPLALDDQEFAFEIRDLPLGVPLTLEAGEGASGLWGAPPESLPPPELRARKDVAFHAAPLVRADYQGTLEEAVRVFEGVRIELAGVWVSEGGGLGAVGDIGVRLRERLDRAINPWDAIARKATGRR